MRLFKINNGGGITVLFVLLVPVFVSFLMAIVVFGQIAIAKARLQIATDRAAYAGAASLAHSMDEIARANWKIHRSYLDLRHDFETMSQRNESTAKARYDNYNSEAEHHSDEIRDAISRMSDDAHEYAESTFQINSNGGSCDIRINSDISISDSLYPSSQWRTLNYNYIKGESFIDPNGVDGKNFRVLKYLAKKRDSGPTVLVSAIKAIKPLVHIGNPYIVVRVEAAAMAYGGSISKFALLGGDKLDDEGVVGSNSDELYRSTIIPTAFAVMR